MNVSVCVTGEGKSIHDLLLCGLRAPPLISAPELKAQFILNPDDFVRNRYSKQHPPPRTTTLKAILCNEQLAPGLR